jgi:hypothetical protein
MTADQLLEQAAFVVRDRRHTYGQPRDLFEQIAKRWSFVLGLGKMLRAGTISQEMHDAARAFQTSFAIANLDPIRTTPFLRVPGAGGEPDLNERQLDARRRVHAALQALGGINSPAGSCLWHVAGCGCSIREWAIRRGWSGRSVRQEQAQGILIAALGVLAGERRPPL